MDDGRLTDAEIRRALAELMTAENVDEALGWPSGTARRRRWERDGLPPADAELGGVALWFRLTIDRWRVLEPPTTSEVTPPPSDSGAGLPAGLLDHTDADEAEADVAGGEPAPENEPVQPDELEHATDDEPEDEEEPGDESTDEEDAPDEPDDSAAAPAPPADELPGTPITSGFDVDAGEPVFAKVKGEWRPAVVDARTRETVIVQYRVGKGPLDQRVVRLGVDGVRRL